jgi:Protein of unknown function (DUF2971)
MRDPFEAQPWRFTFAGYGGPDPNDKDALAAQASEYLRFQREFNEGVRDCSHLLSLTIDAEPDVAGEQEPFCCGWARARMWEQYAENHRGVCLVFDREGLTDAVLRSNAGVAVYNQPVVYDSDGLRKPTVDRDALEKERGYAARYIDDNHESLFFTKARDWETEHEFRFVALARDDRLRSVKYGASLTAVIAGERLPEWEKTAVVAACNSAGAQALGVRWNVAAFGNLRPGLVDLAAK